MTTPLEAIKAGIEALEPLKNMFHRLGGEKRKRTDTADITFGQLDRARAAHALLSQVEATQVPSVEEVAREVHQGFMRSKEPIEIAERILALFKGEKK